MAFTLSVISCCLLRGQLGKYAVRVWLLGGLFHRRGLRLFLLGLPFFLSWARWPSMVVI